MAMASATTDLADMSAYKAEAISAHILKQLAGVAQRRAGTGTGTGSGTGSGRIAPLIVGLQGPQGSGKTTVTELVQDRLRQRGTTSAVFSLDDLYLPHAALQNVARQHPQNKLLQGRGQPGTHDMPLGSSLLTQLKTAAPGSEVRLPVYDKSMHNGQGDRSTDTVTVTMPVDVVIFEGWCLGFYPLEDAELAKRHNEARSAAAHSAEGGGALSATFCSQHPLESLREINESLGGFLEWYQHIDAFVQLRPDNLHNVFAWRLQAEHAMKSKGKPGMADEQVHAFVARYMPGYELFGDGVTRSDAPWSGHGLHLDLDRERNVVAQGTF